MEWALAKDGSSHADLPDPKGSQQLLPVQEHLCLTHVHAVSIAVTLYPLGEDLYLFRTDITYVEMEDVEQPIGRPAGVRVERQSAQWLGS